MENQPSIQYEQAPQDSYESVMADLIKKAVIFGATGIVLLSAFISSATIIDAGDQGVVTRFGKIQGETLSSGYHFVIPFVDDVKIFSIREMKIEAVAGAASKDLQSVRTSAAVNLNLDPSKINALYQEIGVDWSSRIVDPAIQEVIKATTSQFTAEELITRRPEVSSLLTKALTERLAAKYIRVQSVSITDFQFSEEFNRSIEAKQVAQQQALKAQQDLERVRIEAQQQVARAQAEADALRAQREQITPELLELRRIEAQKTAIEKWNGVLPQYSLGSATPFIQLPSGN